MPSSTTKQAKVMSAIAHGWHPSKGSVAKIPLKVAKEFHAADAGHKYGKGGKHKAHGGPVDKALHIARKYAKKAEGGDVEDDDTQPLPKGDKYGPAVVGEAHTPADTPKPPPMSPEQMDAWEKEHGSIRATRPTPTERVSDTVTEALSGDLTGNYSPTANYNARRLVSGIGDLLNWTPAAVPGAAANLIDAKNHGDIGGAAMAAIGLLPGGGKIKDMTTKGAQIAKQIYDHVLEGALESGPQIAKNLKQYYPKDIAATAGYLGVDQNGINSLKANLSPGAQQAFDQHYSKLFGTQPPIPKAPTVKESFNNILEESGHEPLGPEGWHDIHHSEYTEPPIEHPPEQSFSSSLLQALKIHSDEGGPWKELLPTDKDKAWMYNINGTKSAEELLPQHSWGDIHYGKIVRSLADKPASEGLPKTTLKSATWQNMMDKIDVKPLVTRMSQYNLSKDNIENILSYLPEHKIDQIKGYLGSELESAGYNVPDTLLHLSPTAAAHKKIEGQLKPINWAEYMPKERATTDYPRPGNEDVQWNGVTPQQIKELGFNPDNIIWKGGHHDNYPQQLSDFSKKWSEPAFFGAASPDVAKSYGKPMPYVARPNKAFEVDWGQLVKQFSPQSLYNSGTAHYDSTIMNNLAKYGQKIGADMFVVHGIHDLGPSPHTQYLVLNPAILRAPHAKFDPEKFHLRQPLAGIAGLAAGAGLYSYGDKAEAAEAHKEGGKVKHKQIDEDPQDHEFIDFARGGLIDSDIPGRTDKIPMRVRPGAYVLPADIPSALGQGNTKAGAEILKKMFTHSAYGLPPPHVHSTHQFQPPHMLRFPHKARGGKVAAEKVLPANHQLGMKVPKGGSMCGNCRFLETTRTCGNKGFIQWNGGPKLPHPANEYCCDLYEHHQPEAKADGGASDHVPIVTAGGEFIIHPDVVKEVGNGDMKKGHAVLDKFVIHTRKEHIKTLKGLKPPK